ITDTVLAYADFDNDGKADLLIRNPAGQMRIRFMDGATNLGETAIATPLPPVWTPEAVADFDGNGTADIWWRRSTDSAVIIWLMNGAPIVTSQGQGVFDANEWIVEGADDMDGDGDADLLLRRQSNGNILI